MYFAKNFPKKIPRIAAKIPEIIIVIKMTIRWEDVIVCKMSLRAAAVPERALFIV